MKTETTPIVRVTRRFDYPAARVFDAWLDPSLARRFIFATEDGEMVRVEIDARVGGRYVITERRDGEDVEHLGEYLEIDRPRKLVFTLAVPIYNPDPTVVTVEIQPIGAGCELTLTHELSGTWIGFAAKLESGWGKFLGTLAGVVTPGASPNATGNPDYVTFPERAAVRFERLLPGPIERVWSYLIEPEKRATWFAGGPMDLRVSGQVELHFDHNNISAEPTPERYRAKTTGSQAHGHITRCEPPRLLGFTWLEDMGDYSETVFELTSQGAEVLLVVTHTHLPNRDLMVSVAGGWQAHILILEDRLRGREPRPFWSTHDQLKSDNEQRITPADLPETPRSQASC